MAPQRYRHYKGGLYELVGEAIMEADLAPMIVYRAADGRLWVRPRANFFEHVECDGVRVARFSPVD